MALLAHVRAGCPGALLATTHSSYHCASAAISWVLPCSKTLAFRDASGGAGAPTAESTARAPDPVLYPDSYPCARHLEWRASGTLVIRAYPAAGRLRKATLHHRRSVTGTGFRRAGRRCLQDRSALRGSANGPSTSAGARPVEGSVYGHDFARAAHTAHRRTGLYRAAGPVRRAVARGAAPGVPAKGAPWL